MDVTNQKEKNLKSKKTPCKTCKKPKVIEKLDPIEEVQLDVYVPTLDEIKLAYYELTSFGGIKKDKKELIKKVYETLFGEEFDFNCSSCVSTQARKFHNYLTLKLKLKL